MIPRWPLVLQGDDNDDCLSCLALGAPVCSSTLITKYQCQLQYVECGFLLRHDSPHLMQCYHLALASSRAWLVTGKLTGFGRLCRSYTAKTLSHLDKMPFQILAAGDEHSDVIQHLQQHVQLTFLVRPACT